MRAKRIAFISECVRVDHAGGPETTNQHAQSQHSLDAVALASNSTATEAQLAKVMAMLRQGPKTTFDLREHGILMPAARVFQLKRERGHEITTELLPLYDPQGIRHSKCARYHLVREALSNGPGYDG
jgi:hypothetical protein